VLAAMGMGNKMDKVEEVLDRYFEVSDARASWEHRWNHPAHWNTCI